MTTAHATPTATVAEAAGVAVCRLSDLTPERGVAALLDGIPVALFRVMDDDGDRVYALAHRDPFTGANVLARGIVGDTGGRWYVASPLHKQRFDLVTGACLDDDRVSVPTFAVRVTADGDVMLSP